MFAMIPLLLAIAASDEDTIINLTSPGFRDYVLKRDDTTIWLVLFVARGPKVGKACAKAVREFRKASITAKSLARFAMVNLTEEPFLQRRIGIDYVPLLKIYYPGGTEDYRGKLNENGYLECISAKMPNFVRTFDRKWLDEPLPSIVLFTDQIRIPTVWASLSLQYRDQFLRFGICSEFHLHREMSIARLPTVYFYNNSNAIRYRGEMNEAELKSAIDSYLNGSLSADDAFDDEGFYRLTEFEEHCRGRDFCVLHTGSGLPPEYRRVRQICKRHPMKFFYGAKGAPLKDLKEDVYYIWNPRRKGIIEVEDVANLAGAIDRVIDGGAKWTPAREAKEDAGDDESPL